jgi:hypothetical protein
MTTRRNRLALTAAAIASAAAGLSALVMLIDGWGNNLAHPEWGSVGVQLLRLGTTAYDDDVSAPGGVGRPGPREISNAVSAQSGSIVNPVSASDFLWQWGQFVDHDITLVDPAEPLEAFDIPVPTGDPFFDPDWSGDDVIPLDRSAWDPTTGTDATNPRQQVESITAFLDASMVYGSDAVRAEALRTLVGGELKTSAGDLLPFNVDGLPNLGGPDPSLFLAGDIRANEQIGLTSMHTLFVREHNRLVRLVRDMRPGWSDEALYQFTRAIVAGEIQAITFREFLPILIGPDAIPPYSSYDPDLNPGISNEFATGSYRVGHTLLSPVLRRIDAAGNEVPGGHVELRDAFLAPSLIIDGGGIEPILRGLSAQRAQNVDRFVIDEVRNFLFGPPGAGGFDLVSLNIQRGRDHGLASYNQARVDFGLAPAAGFNDISTDPDVRADLASVYAHVDDVDMWIGAISEDHYPGALVGELLRTIIADQFIRLRDGDRFWHEATAHSVIRVFLEQVTLADVIRWNTDIDDEIDDDVFRVPTLPCLADLDGDGFVGFVDLLELLGTWGGPGTADLDGDGIVNLPDLLLLLSTWGACDE